jgi:hypothetical protein
MTAQLPTVDLPSMLDMMTSSAGTLKDGLWFLKRPNDTTVREFGDTVSSASFATGRSKGLASKCWKAGLKASSFKAVDLKAGVLGALSVGGLIATAAQAALSPRVSNC